MRLRSLLPIAVAAALVVRPAVPGAQVRPAGAWRTIDTEHFRVHFTPELAALAARTARNAEIAYGRLAAELVPPRGTVDIVLADNADYSNGWATVFPTNRIVLFARPPVDVAALRNHADWNLILVTHELAHIFHLDRAKGWWGQAQRIFGRAPALFPNTYAPSWITEGLAVHYESRAGIGGRLEGSLFPAHLRAAAATGALPSLDALSLAAPRFPDANSVYLYGSYAMSHDEPRAMRSFVERSSERLLPWLHDANARAAFGEGFTAQWARWRDSVVRAEGGAAAAEPGVRELTRHPFEASFPRFTSDSTLVYLASDGRRTRGLYALTLDGERDRLGRRTSSDAPARLSDGRWLQAELDYVDPWTLRSDITVGTGLARRRATKDQRLSNPDVHPVSGRIVALRTDPGTTSIVELDLGDRLAPRVIAAGTLDRTWSEPRWSRDGALIAAARWERGGRSAIVVLDDRGAERIAFAPRGARFSVTSSPVWEPGDTTLLFVSDHEGRAMIYRGDVRTGAIGLVWGTRTALSMPDVSPDGRRVAAVELRGDGYRVLARETPRDVALALPPAADAAPPALPAPEAVDEGERYDPARYLRLSWWMPVVEQTGTGQVRVGALSSGRDPVGRHAYSIAAAWEFTNSEETLDASYTYAGLGNPLLSASGESSWDHAPVFDNASNFVGYLARRTTSFAGYATLQRPRIRASSYLMLGAEIEQSEYRTYPATLLGFLDPRFAGRYIEKAALVAVGFNTLQQPQRALSATDGLAVDVQHRERADAGIAFEGVRESIVTAVAAKSLPLPGFSQHIVAVRGAYGVTSHRAASGFGVGGVSGSMLELLPGIAIGSSRRTFGVRGFPESRQAGVRAVAASAEYRAPLTLIGRGLGLLPLFFQQASLTGFFDSGAAWCSFEVSGSYLCTPDSVDRAWMKSYGLEFGLDAAVHYDWVYRFRLGIAHPYRGRVFAEQNNTIYFSLGSSW